MIASAIFENLSRREAGTKRYATVVTLGSDAKNKVLKLKWLNRRLHQTQRPCLHQSRHQMQYLHIDHYVSTLIISFEVNR